MNETGENLSIDGLTFWLGADAEAVLRAHVERTRLLNPEEANDE